MKIDIFDVGHGACSVITCPDGKRLMIDCGYKKDPPYWWPSIQFYGEALSGLILTNLDEDHASDFESTLRCVTVSSVCLNNTIDAARLRSLKPDGMASGIRAVHSYLQNPSRLNVLLDLPQITVSMFRFPFEAFGDMTAAKRSNNLSLITFIEYGQFCIVYPGDLEEAAWKQGISNPQLRTLLQRVRLFVTSHHGRESGCCAELFKQGVCSPDAFIISDKEIVHDTQETTDWYRGHANGLHRILESPWDTPDKRYVFTTRSDHCISIDVQRDGAYILHPNSSVQQNVEPKKPEALALTLPSPLLNGILGSNLLKKST